MSEDRISDSELNALVDGELDPARQAEIEISLAEDPDSARRVARYRSQNAGLHALYDDILHEDTSAEDCCCVWKRADLVCRPGPRWPPRSPCLWWGQRVAGWCAARSRSGACPAGCGSASADRHAGADGARLDGPCGES